MNLEENLLDKEEINEGLSDHENRIPCDFPESQKNQETTMLNNLGKNTEKQQKRILVPWTDQQKNVVKKFFATHIQNKIPPKKAECDKLISKNPDLFQNKNWVKIKVFIQNIYKKQIK